MRPTDPDAERLLMAALRLEGAPWPRALQAYGAQLLALATRCEGPAAKAEVYRWFMREAGGALVVRDPQRRQNLRDAFHEAIATMPDLLLRFRAGLDPGRRPNLRSMLVKWIEWAANEHYRREQRHAKRRFPYRADDRLTPERPDHVVLLREVLALLDGADPTRRALRLVGLGVPIAEAARRTGVSRQKIYRVRALLIAARDAEPGDDE